MSATHAPRQPSCKRHKDCPDGCPHTCHRYAPPAPVCEKCGHMEHPDGECCWPLRRGPAGYVHKHCNCGGKRTPTLAPDLSPCTDCPPSDTTHAKAEHAPDDEMRPEYDFREGERGKYFERYNAPPAPERPSDEDFETWCREDRSLAIREARRARESEAAKDAEIAALKGMIAYALEAPDAEATKTILTDALDGVTGADNVSDVRGERERLRGLIEAAPHAGMEEAVLGGHRSCSLAYRPDPRETDTRRCDCWKSRAALEGKP